MGRDRRGRCPGGKASYRDGPPRVPPAEGAYMHMDMDMDMEPALALGSS